MDAKEAVQKAIDYTKDVFKGEKLSNVGLEEIFFDESKGVWEITVGFSRPWDYPSSMPSLPSIVRDMQGKTQPLRREYKVVKIGKNDGEVKSIEIRELAS